MNSGAMRKCKSYHASLASMSGWVQKSIQWRVRTAMLVSGRRWLWQE